MKNPLYFKALPDDAPFCNCTKELATLLRFADSLNDVVLTYVIEPGTLNVFTPFCFISPLFL